jgi:outer membrane biogenesis lipoprotein LolB
MTSAKPRPHFPRERRAHRATIALALLLVTLLAACGSLPQRDESSAVYAAPITAAKNFSLAGRFSAKRGKDQVSGQFRYTQNNAERTLNLFSPLGTPLADIVANRTTATLTQANGSTQTAASLAELLRTVIDLPVTDAMFSAWLQGLPSAVNPSALTEMERDASGLPARFVESGWEIVVSARMEASANQATSVQSAPKRMRWRLQAEADTELRWVVDEWSSP